MEKPRNATKGGSNAQKGVSPTPLSSAGEVGDTGDVVCDFRDEVASLEEALSQMGASSKCPFALYNVADHHLNNLYHQEHWQSNQAHEDQMCYCIQVRVTLGEGGGGQPPPSPAWTGSLIANIFQDGLEEWSTEAVVLAPGEAILFFRWWSLKEGLPLGDARDVGFCLGAQLIGPGERLRWKWWWVLSRKVIEPSQMPLWKRALRSGGQDIPREQWRQTRPLQQHITSKIGCNSWKKMLLKWRGDMVKWVIMGLSGGMLVLSVWVGVEDGVEDRVPHNYWETLLVDLPLQGEGVQIGEVSRVPISWPWLGGLGRATEQEGWEDIWAWRSICQSLRMKRPRMLWLTIHDGGM